MRILLKTTRKVTVPFYTKLTDFQKRNEIPWLRPLFLLVMDNMYMKMCLQQWWNYNDRSKPSCFDRHLSQ